MSTTKAVSNHGVLNTNRPGRRGDARPLESAPCFSLMRELARASADGTGNTHKLSESYRTWIYVEASKSMSRRRASRQVNIRDGSLWCCFIPEKIAVIRIVTVWIHRNASYETSQFCPVILVNEFKMHTRDRREMSPSRSLGSGARQGRRRSWRTLHLEIYH
jgi:hypothetical protein